MKRLAAVSILGLSAVLIAATARPPASPPAGPEQAVSAQAGAPLVFRNQIVFDQQGLGLEYLRMLVPKDWAFNGGIVWDFTKNPPASALSFTVTSPDGNSVIQQFPHLNMYWSPDQSLQYSFAQMGSTILQPLGAIDFLRAVFIPQARQGVTDLKVLETQPLPAVAQQVLAKSQLTLNLYSQISPLSPFELRADAGRVKVEYTSNGRRFVEDFGVGITYNITNSVTMSGMTVTSVAWSPTVTSFRCPAEEMASRIRLFQLSLTSRFDNPVWNVAYTRLCAIVTREKLRQQQAIFARYQQIHQTLEECNDIIWQTFQNKSAAEDRMFQGYSEALRGVDTYLDPVNNVNIELPTGYANAWTNGTDYVFSDSANFNPNALSTGNWQRMAPRR
jgi:hypothetical protein